MSFESNLSTYHTLNRQGVKYIDRMSERLVKASPEEQAKLMEEANQHFEALKELYETLGKEMAAKMKPKWWQFWEWW